MPITIDLLEDDDDDDDLLISSGRTFEHKPRVVAPRVVSSSTVAAAASVATPATKGGSSVEENDARVCLGRFFTQLVDTRYCSGKAQPGETVSLARSATSSVPQIIVSNLQGVKMGHLSRDCSPKVAHLLVKLGQAVSVSARVISAGSLEVFVHTKPPAAGKPKLSLSHTFQRVLLVVGHSSFHADPFLSKHIQEERAAMMQPTLPPQAVPSAPSVTPSPHGMARAVKPATSAGKENKHSQNNPSGGGTTSAVEKRFFEMQQQFAAERGGGDDDDEDSVTKDLEAALMKDAPEPLHMEKADVNWEEQHHELDTMFDEQLAAQLQDLPQIPMPAQFAHLDLFDYQQDGIRWLVQQEKTRHKNIPPFYTQLGQGRYKCNITCVIQQKAPQPIRGSILADDMGLGKTLQTLGLILSNPPTGQTGYPYKRLGLGAKRFPRTTLIVCPLSVMANWRIQIHQHVNGGRGKQPHLVQAIYHGPRRETELLRLVNGELDVLIVSYHTLVSDSLKYIERLKNEKEEKKNGTFKRRRKEDQKPLLFDEIFHRVVLDESHIIRNANTGFFKAAKLLKTYHKLCLTGTPFVNKPADIHSLLVFLDVEPLKYRKVFQEYVVQKIQDRKEVGLATLRTTMAHVALRRTKAKVSHKIQLVEKKVQMYMIEFPPGPHKDVHDMLYQSARMAFVGLLRAGGEDEVFQNYMVILELVLRVRQSCCHVALVPEERRQSAVNLFQRVQEKGGLEGLDIEELGNLLSRLVGELEQDEVHECAVCMEEMDSESAVILRSCKHIFCEACMQKVVTRTCPICRAAYTPQDLIKKKDAEEAKNKKASTGKKKKEVNEFGRSPKMEAMLNAMDQMAPDEKGVIFSQWTSTLNLLEREMRSLGHTYTRIDGTMNALERIAAMEAFETERCDSMRYPRFILCSLHACGTGINLTRGNVVFMMDPWWNVAAENQAMDRVHRIGQKRNVRVMRFLMKDSLEERMVALQDSKAALGKGSLEKLDRDEKRKARLTALRDLFQVDSVEELWDEPEEDE